MPGEAVRAALFVSVLVAAAASCARKDPTGQPCKHAEECGSGYDCYQQVCVHVCATPGECPQGTTCTRYRCLKPEAAATAAIPADLATPPAPDAIAAELRAIRRELEIVRREQQRLTELVEGKTDKTPPAQSAPQKRTGIR